MAYHWSINGEESYYQVELLSTRLQYNEIVIPANKTIGLAAVSSFFYDGYNQYNYTCAVLWQWGEKKNKQRRANLIN